MRWIDIVSLDFIKVFSYCKFRKTNYICNNFIYISMLNSNDNFFVANAGMVECCLDIDLYG